MARHHRFILYVLVLSIAFVLMVPGPAMAYIGPGTGLEMLPQFFALLGFLGLAIGSILLWPFMKLIGLFRRKRPVNAAPLSTVPTEVDEEPIVAAVVQANGTPSGEQGIRPAVIGSESLRASESQGNGQQS